MFGRNEVASRFHKDDGTLLVHSIWKTIQGEGPDMGTPAVFVRLAKCNLRCFFCDTEFDQGQEMDVIKVLDTVMQEAGDNVNLVVMTGGEPLLQNIVPFVAACNGAGLRVSIETAGTVFCPGMEYLFNFREMNQVVCSPKTPKLNEELIPYIYAYKYIVAFGNIHPDDGLPMMSTQIPGKEDMLYRPGRTFPGPIFVQPMDELDPGKNQTNMEWTAKVAMQYGYRLSLQMHKIVGVP